jgi:hypothetical protein
MGDFREAIYYPVRAFLSGDNPYDTFNYIAKYPVDQIFPPYSPLTLLLHSPLGLLPLGTAELAYFALTVLLTVVVARLALEASGLSVRLATVLGLSSLVLASRPGHWNLLVGQSTLEMVLGAYLALHLARNRPALAGLGLALATIKPTYGVPVALLMAAQRQWRALALGTGITAAATFVPTFVLARPLGLGAFIETMGTSYANFVAQETVDPVSCPVRVDVLALAGRLMGGPLAASSELCLTGLVFAIGAWGVSRVSLPANGENGRRLALLLASLTMLVASYQQSYNALLLVAPVVFVAAGRWAPAAVESPALRALLLCLLLVPAVNYAASFTGAAVVEGYPALRIAVVSANGLALLVAYLLCVVTSLRAVPHADRAAA